MSNPMKDLDDLAKKIAMTLPEEAKAQITKRLNQQIGDSLKLLNILRAGVEANTGYIVEVPLEAVSDFIKGQDSEDRLTEALSRAGLVISGSMSMDKDDGPQFLIAIVDNVMFCHSFDRLVTHSRIEELIDYLMIKGFESHGMVDRVLHSQNFIMPEGAKIIAKGRACKVRVGHDGSYSIETNLPTQVKAMLASDMPDELKEAMEQGKGFTIESPLEEICENGAPEGCECGFCQVKDQARSAMAKENGEVH